jgi:gluconate 2-dehydrogenase gamma chain
MNAPGSTSGAVTFLNTHEADTVDAVAARIIPGSADDPGAREAGAVVYIDRALAGAYRHLRQFYRAGLAGLDDASVDQHGRKFVDLDESQQDAVLEQLAQGELGPAVAAERAEAGSDQVDLASLPYFFAVVRQHVVEGTFGDPVYGGNRDTVGWRMVGFPGARWGYGEKEMQYGFDAATLDTVTLQELRDQRDDQKRGGPEHG